jgi:heterotetrameric sarcosine oxidase gamma subunit
MKLSPLHSTLTELSARFEDRDGWQVAAQIGDSTAGKAAAAQDVAIADLSHAGKLVVEGPMAGDTIDSALATGAADLAVLAGSDHGSFSVYRLRQDQYFVHTFPGAEGELAAKIQAAAPTPTSSADLVTISNVTEGRSALLILGPKAGALLSRLCGINFSDAAFPNVAARQSSVARTSQLVLRHDMHDQPAFALIGERSLAAYLWSTTLQAGGDLGILPIGQSDLAD